MNRGSRLDRREPFLCPGSRCQGTVRAQLLAEKGNLRNKLSVATELKIHVKGADEVCDSGGTKAELGRECLWRKGLGECPHSVRLTCFFSWMYMGGCM